MLHSLPNALQVLLAPFLLLTHSNLRDDTTQTILTQQTPSPLSFTLRHEHAIANNTHVLLSDVPQSMYHPQLLSGFGLTLQRKNIQTYKPSSFKAFQTSRAENARLDGVTDADLWVQSHTSAPDVEDRGTLLNLAKMTNNAYYERKDKYWYALGQQWGNDSYPFGWEPDSDGLRGYIFVSEDNSTVVLSIKGTSAGWAVGGGGPTVKKDKLNDNLMFSCCCARVGPTWSTVCDCYSGGYKCDQSCLQNALTGESLFYSVAINLYRNVTYLYPEANIWITGHSLGGSLASLIGATFGPPVVAFEAPGEKVAAARLHLPSPPSTHHITHVYHTADPIPMGVCTGMTSLCSVGGYALETKCHLGQTILYDTVSKFNWAVDLRTHSIIKVIEYVLANDWEPPSEGKAGRQVPEITHEDDCVDCYNWEFGDFKQTKNLLE